MQQQSEIYPEIIPTKLLRNKLIPATNLKRILNNIRNYLAGNAKGMTRDEALTRETINLLFCKIFDELHTPKNELVSFRVEVGDEAKDVKKRLDLIFQKVKQEYPEIFSYADKINLDEKCIAYVVSELQQYSIIDASREVVGEAFEAFISPALRGGEGQFFTPKNIVEAVVDLIDPKPEEKIIDPACGSGAFLTVSLDKIGKKIRMERYLDIASKQIRGIEKDTFLAKVARAYLAILGNGKNCIFCENSLDYNSWQKNTRDKIKLGEFDVVITNPPFGSKIPIEDKTILSNFELGYKWEQNEDGKWLKTNNLRAYQPPQILFVELALKLLKPGGRAGIVLPDGLFGNNSDGYVRQFLLENTKIIAIIDCPPEAFQPSTATKTTVIIFEKKITSENYPVFMSIVEKCGHDRRGREICEDEFPLVQKKFKEKQIDSSKSHDRLGFYVPVLELKNGEKILAPRYYDPAIKYELDKLQKSGKYLLKTVGELVEEKELEIKRGNEVGSDKYGTGDIPFVRTSDISNWEIRYNPETSVDEDTYLEYSKSQDIRDEDLLFVNDGGRMVGEVALKTKFDARLLIQSHIRRIRVTKKLLTPYLLLAILKMPIVRKQIVSKVFVQSTIPSLGNRLLEVVLPIPKDAKLREQISESIKELVLQRAVAKKKIHEYLATESLTP